MWTFKEVPSQWTDFYSGIGVTPGNSVLITAQGVRDLFLHTSGTQPDQDDFGIKIPAGEQFIVDENIDVLWIRSAPAALATAVVQLQSGAIRKRPQPEGGSVEYDENLVFRTAALELTAEKTQQLNDTTPVKLTCFDSFIRQHPDITADAIGHQIIIHTKGWYWLSAGVNAEFQGNEQLDIYVFRNGQQATFNPLRLQGSGNGKPISGQWGSLVYVDESLLPCTFDLRGQNGDSGNFTLSWLSSIFIMEYKGDN